MMMEPKITISELRLRMSTTKFFGTLGLGLTTLKLEPPCWNPNRGTENPGT